MGLIMMCVLPSAIHPLSLSVPHDMPILAPILLPLCISPIKIHPKRVRTEMEKAKKDGARVALLPGQGGGE